MENDIYTEFTNDAKSNQIAADVNKLLNKRLTGKLDGLYWVTCDVYICVFVLLLLLLFCVCRNWGNILIVRRCWAINFGKGEFSDVRCVHNLSKTAPEFIIIWHSMVRWYQTMTEYTHIYRHSSHTHPIEANIRVAKALMSAWNWYFEGILWEQEIRTCDKLRIKRSSRPTLVVCLEILQRPYTRINGMQRMCDRVTTTQEDAQCYWKWNEQKRNGTNSPHMNNGSYHENDKECQTILYIILSCFTIIHVGQRNFNIYTIIY